MIIKDIPLKSRHSTETPTRVPNFHVPGGGGQPSKSSLIMAGYVAAQHSTEIFSLLLPFFPVLIFPY